LEAESLALLTDLDIQLSQLSAVPQLGGFCGDRLRRKARTGHNHSISEDLHMILRPASSYCRWATALTRASRSASTGRRSVTLTQQTSASEKLLRR